VSLAVHAWHSVQEKNTYEVGRICLDVCMNGLNRLWTL